jgi:hypothetical protein
VTTDAGRDARLAFLFQQTAVDACVVLAFLIYAQAGVEPLHQVRIAMALAAVRRNIECFWLAKIAFIYVVRGLRCGGVRITAVTIVAHQAARFVNVVIEQLGRRADTRIVKLGVTLDAGVFLLGAHGRNA